MTREQRLEAELGNATRQHEACATKLWDAERRVKRLEELPDPIRCLRLAMADAAIPAEFRTELIGYFCNSWNAALAEPVPNAAPQETLADENPNTSSEHVRERLNVPAVAAPSSSLHDAAKRVVETQRNDTRTLDEKLRDGVRFVIGPGND